MIIAGIDPGKMTGIVVFEHDHVAMSEAMPIDEVFHWLPTLIEMVDEVVIERFTISNRTVKSSRQMDAVYIIGATMFQCSRTGVPCALQTPADAKNAFPDTKLKELGMLNESPHIRDATRHALLHNRKAGKRK